MFKREELKSKKEKQERQGNGCVADSRGGNHMALYKRVFSPLFIDKENEEWHSLV